MISVAQPSRQTRHLELFLPSQCANGIRANYCGVRVLRSLDGALAGFIAEPSWPTEAYMLFAALVLS